MYLLCKVVVFLLVLLGCVSEMLAAPVKLREAVIRDTVEDAKPAADGDEVRLKF